MVFDEETQKRVDYFESTPYHQFIGLKVDNFGDGYAELRLPVKKEIINANGAVHGGIYYTVCDLAASTALYTLIGEDHFSATSDINVSVVAAAYAGELIGKARVLKTGKRMAFIEASVSTEEGELIAAARITKTILPKTKIK